MASFVRKWEGWGKNYHGLVTKEVRKIKLNKSDQCDVVRGNSYLIQIMTIRECCFKRARKIRYNFLDAYFYSFNVQKCSMESASEAKPKLAGGKR